MDIAHAHFNRQLSSCYYSAYDPWRAWSREDSTRSSNLGHFVACDVDAVLHLDGYGHASQSP